MANGWHRKKNDAAARARAAEYRSPAYRAARALVAAQVDAGTACCWRCGGPLAPGRWHLGHADDNRSVLMGGEHDRCNLRAAARKGALIANARRRAKRAGVTALRM